MGTRASVVATYLQQQEQKSCCLDSVILCTSLCGKGHMCYTYSEQRAIFVECCLKAKSYVNTSLTEPSDSMIKLLGHTVRVPRSVEGWKWRHMPFFPEQKVFWDLWVVVDKSEVPILSLPNHFVWFRNLETIFQILISAIYVPHNVGLLWVSYQFHNFTQKLSTNNPFISTYNKSLFMNTSEGTQNSWSVQCTHVWILLPCPTAQIHVNLTETNDTTDKNPSR